MLVIPERRKSIFFKPAGFTLIELFLVLVIIGILSAIVILISSQWYEAAYLARAKADLRSIYYSLQLYAGDHNGNYPSDTNRDVPPGLEEYLSPGLWPYAAWPQSVFDWDNWDDPVTGEKIYQISIRFCPLGQPAQCRFPKTVWARDFDINSSVYYCVSGPCRAHISEPIDHPGYCVNCADWLEHYNILLRH